MVWEQGFKQEMALLPRGVVPGFLWVETTRALCQRLSVIWRSHTCRVSKVWTS